MGTVKVTIGVGDPQGRQFEELDVTVDTGSTYTESPGQCSRGWEYRSKGRYLRDCRRQNRPRRRRRSHHQAARTAVPHAGHIRRGERTKPARRSLPGAGRPRCRLPGGTTDTHQPATPLANSPIPRLRRSWPAGQDHLQQLTKHKQQFCAKPPRPKNQKLGIRSS